MPKSPLINYLKEIPDVYQALGSGHALLENSGFDEKLHHLILLRASQINQCAYCVKLHTTDARKAGETNERLDRLIVWQNVTDFTEKEKAAFLWTEALTYLNDDSDYSTLRTQVRVYFKETELAQLTAIIVMINVWNRFHKANH